MKIDCVYEPHLKPRYIFAAGIYLFYPSNKITHSIKQHFHHVRLWFLTVFHSNPCLRKAARGMIISRGRSAVGNYSISRSRVTRENHAVSIMKKKMAFWKTVVSWSIGDLFYMILAMLHTWKQAHACCLVGPDRVFTVYD